MTIQSAAERQKIVDNANYLHYLPEHLRGAYTEGLHDSQLTHLRAQIALMDVRIKMLLQTLDQQVLTIEKIMADLAAEFPELVPEAVERIALYLQTYLPDGFIDSRTFRSLDRLAEKYEAAMRDKRLIQAGEALDQLFKAIRAGRRDGEVWKEIDAVMESRRKLVLAEEQRLLQTRQMMTAEAALALARAIIESTRDSVTLYVPDRETQELILRTAERNYAARLTGTVDLSTDAITVD